MYLNRIINRKHIIERYVVKLYTYLLIIGCAIAPSGCNAKKLVIGDKAPDFTLKDDLGKNRSLSEFLGKKVVLYFYPKDNTPGCTKEACSLANGYNTFEKNNIAVLGISYDSVSSHQKFKAKYKLPFILLSDADKKVAKLYGAAGTWLFFFSAPIASRITFLIDEKGIIKAIINDVDVSHHANEVLKYFEIQEGPGKE